MSSHSVLPRQDTSLIPLFQTGRQEKACRKITVSRAGILIIAIVWTVFIPGLAVVFAFFFILVQGQTRRAASGIAGISGIVSVTAVVARIRIVIIDTIAALIA